MTELQNRLLIMLKWFHDFCIENHLQYYAIGGTLLGAVRHNGFIPWDDDIDLGMPRNDYDNLISCMQIISEKSDYVLEKPLENKDFVYQFCKLYDTKTTLVENTRYKTQRGIYLDIFPLDGIGNTREESKKNFKPISRKNNYIMTKVCAFSGHRKFYKNLAILLSRCMPFPKWQSTLRHLDKLCRTKRFEDYDYVTNPYGAWGDREIFERKWFGESPLMLKFENIEIFAPVDYHSFLTQMYGDYMQLPPKEKQVTHHDYLLLDLKKSYLDR